ncbi:hypothetical protein [Clostridium paraputrificum]|uniref:hypothetical protein n=1 Tax=Clostridium paraputrificum TaxID=29363 RepID=UPI0034A2FC30
MTLMQPMRINNDIYLKKETKRGSFFANSLNYSLKKSFKERDNCICTSEYNILREEKNKLNNFMK